jgi:putative ABC transport system permease protein
MNSFWQDLRYGLRLLKKSPGFSMIAILALGLGIGANSAIFSVVNAVVLRPLPYPNPERLVMVGYAMREMSPPNFIDIRDQNRVFEKVAALQFWNATLTGVDEPERLQGFLVSPELFRLVGIEPFRGRSFQADEDQAGKDTVVMLSYGLWQRRFASDESIIGKKLTINGRTRTVIGIMPPEFQFYRPVDVWGPLVFDAGDLQARGTAFLIATARMKPGVTMQQAQGDVNGIARRLEQQYPTTNTNVGFSLISVHESVVGIAQTALLLLLAAVGFVLLIACANVANLLLARAASRQKEIAIRMSVGAKRKRLIRQLLTESILLSLLGGVLGLLLGGWAIRLLVANITRNNAINLPRVENISLDSKVLLFTLAVSLLSGILFGLAPALQISQVNLNDTLKEGGGGAASGVRSRRLRSTLVIAEVALSFVLLIGAGLMIRSFVKLLEVKTGFEPKQVLTMDVSLSPRKYAEPRQISDFYAKALDQLQRVPGVTAAGITSNLPLGGSDQSGLFFIEGQPTPVAGNIPRANLRFASPNYFRALGITLKSGRSFTDQDTANSIPVAIVNEAMVRRYWPNEDPLGKRIKVVSSPGVPEQQWLTIVGLVHDVKHSALSSQPRAELYQMYAQNPSNSMTFVVRTTTAPLSLIAPIKTEMLALDKEQPVYNIRTMEQVVSDAASPSRFSMILLGVFAAVALILAAVGIYGVMSYSVSQRTHEIGIRMALGASPRTIHKLVIEQGLKLVLIGEAIGLIAALGVARILAGLLYGVGTADPITFAGVLLLLLGVAMAACYFPARRAVQVDPLRALRYE